MHNNKSQKGNHKRLTQQKKKGGRGEEMIRWKCATKGHENNITVHLHDKITLREEKMMMQNKGVRWERPLAYVVGEHDE